MREIPSLPGFSVFPPHDADIDVELRRSSDRRGTRRTRLCLAGVLTVSVLSGTPAAVAAEPADGRLTDLVNPFIGSQDEGNT